MFRKAQTEHTYSNFYCKLCEQIIRIELGAKGKKAVQGNLKLCEFRVKLLDRCKTCFEDFFSLADPKAEAEAAGKEIDAEEIKERTLKRKEKLFGNIEFVGELHKAGLLSDSITKSIFKTLLDVAKFSDDTIEAGMRFLEKVGPSIEKKIKEIAEKDAKKSKDGTEKKTQKISKEDYDEILDSFEKIMAMTEAPEGGKHCPSNRIKLMIKNTL